MKSDYTKKREVMLLVMELSDRAARIAECRDEVSNGDYQAQMEAVIMAAIQRTKEIYGVNS